MRTGTGCQKSAVFYQFHGTQINLSVSFYCIFNGISGLGKCRRIKNYNIKFLTFLFQLREQCKNSLTNKVHIVG